MNVNRIRSAAIGLGLFGLLAQPYVADAAEIRVFCSTGLKAVMEELVPQFERQTKHTVVVTYGLAVALKQRVEAGEPFDISVLTPALIDDLIGQGKIAADTRTSIARTGLGIAIRRGARRPDIATAEAFTRALLESTSIAYAKEGASGVAFANLIQRLGIDNQLKPKSKLTTTGDEVGEAVARGDVEFGVLPVSEILPVRGAELLGTFPAEVQSYIVMTAGVSANAKQPKAARELTAFLTAPASIPMIRAKGMEPVEQEPYPTLTGRAYKFEKITEGVYYATATGSMITGSNNVVIVGDREVLVVDTGTTPAAARAFQEDLKAITAKPVRYVVNTHFHYDHTDGNQAYAGKADIIAHTYVKDAIQNKNVLQTEPFKTSQLTNVPNRIETLKKQIAEEKDAGRKAALEGELAVATQGWQDLKEIKPTPPTVTYSTKKVLNLGGREVQLLFLGRGHTNGDTFVYLPAEKIVCTGDEMESQLAYMGDAQFDEWVTTLDALKKLDFTTVLPGHGVPFTNKALITAFQSYLTDLQKQVTMLRGQGLSAEAVAQQVDLTSHKGDFPQIQGPGAEVRGVRRMYAWLDEKAKK